MKFAKMFGDAAQLKRRTAILGGFIVLDAINKGVMLVVGIALARCMIKEEYAWYTIANSMMGGMAMLSTLGVSMALLSIGGQHIGDKARMGSLVATCMRYRILFASISAPLVLAGMVFMLHRTGASAIYIAVLVVLLMASLAVQLNQDIAATVLRVAGRYNYVPKVDAALAIVRLLLIGCLIWAAVVATWSVVALTVLLQALAYFAFMRGASQAYYSKRAPADAEDGKRIRRITYNTLPETVKAFVMPQLSVFLLATFASTSSVADIGALSRIGLLYVVPVGLFGALLHPWLARASHETLLPRYAAVVAFGTGLGALLFAGVWFASPLLLWLLGPAYQGLESELLILCGAKSIDLALASVLSLLNARGFVSYIWLIPLTTTIATFGSMPFFDLSSLSQVLWLEYVRFGPMFMCCLFLIGRAIVRLNRLEHQAGVN